MVSEGRPQVFPIFKKFTSVGRGAGNDVAIDDKTLADFHAQIVCDGRDFNVSEREGKGKGVSNGKR
jgi:pSer/pThr/pTyr-binding forkhead associated (FHA) protein